MTENERAKIYDEIQDDEIRDALELAALRRAVERRDAHDSVNRIAAREMLAFEDRRPGEPREKPSQPDNWEPREP